MTQRTSPPSRIPTTLIIDFYDSYTRNLLSLFSQLETTTWNTDQWQERVIVVNVDSLTWEQFIKEILPHVDCIILGPGPGSPHKQEDFSWPTRLITEFGQFLPILGLCLGHQGLATAFGGKVVRAPAPKHGQVSQIRHHTSQPFFRGIPSPFGATQFNSLVVSNEGLPDELEAIAWAESRGEECIMALRHRSSPLWGVQFHPESISSTYGTVLLSNFLSLALDHHSHSNRSPSPSFPTHMLALSTSCARGSGVTTGHANGSSQARWEIRTMQLGRGHKRSPQEVFEKFIKSRSPIGEVWLDSARPTVSPQHSHLFNPAFTWSYNRSRHVVMNRSHVAASISLPPATTFFESLSSAQSVLHRLTRIANPSEPSVPLGFVGSFGYEMKAVTLPHCKTSDTDQSDAEFAFASTVITYEHSTGLWTVSGLLRLEGWTGEEIECETEMQCRFGLGEAEWTTYSSQAKAYFATKPGPSPTDTMFCSKASHLSTDMLTSDLSESDYKPAIESARASIVAGDAYELCITTQFRATLSAALAADPYPLYRSLRQSNPAPYSAYFHLPQSNLAILSSSPERYMQITKQGQVEMKPIKGTVRRSNDPIEDARRKAELEHDEKERAENLMIVDLCRNDLLAFCQVESVLVPRLMVVETYETVHQLVTSIRGQLLPTIDPFEAICRAFPPGSMTGAPKLRSVQLLEELERHRRRGVYAGVFGYVAIDGTADFAVVIRTMVIRGDQLQLGGGGAITHLSDPKKEWEEVLVKIDAVVRESTK